MLMLELRSVKMVLVRSRPLSCRISSKITRNLNWFLVPSFSFLRHCKILGQNRSVSKVLSRTRGERSLRGSA